MKHVFIDLFKSVKGLDKQKQAILALTILVAVTLPVTVFALHPNPVGPTPEVASQPQPQIIEKVAAAATRTQPSQQPATGAQAHKPASTKPSTPTYNTGDEHKQHPTPGKPARQPDTYLLIVSKSSFTIRAGQTIDAFTATTSSNTPFSPVSIDFLASTPAVDNKLELNYNFPIPMYATTRNVKLVALAAATPGTYKVVVGAGTDLYMNDNPILFKTTLTVTILP